MKDLGFLRYFLSIEIAYSSRGYLLSQQKYIANLLDRATLSDQVTFVSSFVFTPMKLRLKLRRDDGTLLPQPTQYRELMGSLIYLSVTHPYIFQAVHILSQFVSVSTSAHYEQYFVCFVISEAPFFDHCYTILIHHLLFELILMQGGLMILTDTAPPKASAFFWAPLISWRIKHQDVVSRLSTEVEYHTIADTALELQWLSDFLCDIGVSVVTRIPMRCK